MVELPEQWWTDVQAQLSDVLKTLDHHNHSLAAAHVAMAIECFPICQQRPEAGPE
jgi:hypothetical protein